MRVRSPLPERGTGKGRLVGSPRVTRSDPRKVRYRYARFSYPFSCLGEKNLPGFLSRTQLRLKLLARPRARFNARRERERESDECFGFETRDKSHIRTLVSICTLSRARESAVLSLSLFLTRDFSMPAFWTPYWHPTAQEVNFETHVDVCRASMCKHSSILACQRSRKRRFLF